MKAAASSSSAGWNHSDPVKAFRPLHNLDIESALGDLGHGPPHCFRNRAAASSRRAILVCCPSLLAVQASKEIASMRPAWLQPLLAPVAILLAGGMIAGSVVWSATKISGDVQMAIGQAVAMAGAGSGGPGGAPTPANADIAKVSTDGNPFIGDANAPAVMAYWFDYQCPYCKAVEETVMPTLVNDYVKTGKLKIVFKDFVFLGPDSLTAALAARAVWEVAPDKFQQWHTAIFAKQDDENGGWGNKDDVLAVTRTIDGIDAAKVEQLMTSKAADYKAAMDRDGQEGAGMGVNGTPGAIVGKQLIVGAAPIAQFRSAIDQVLASH
jgi:protein-disulfide isomerase